MTYIRERKGLGASLFPRHIGVGQCEIVLEPVGTAVQASCRLNSVENRKIEDYASTVLPASTSASGDMLRYNLYCRLERRCNEGGYSGAAKGLAVRFFKLVCIYMPG